MVKRRMYLQSIAKLFICGQQKLHLHWTSGCNAKYENKCLKNGPTKSRPEPSGTVWTLSVGLRRPEPYNDRRIKRENARKSGCS